MQDNRIVTLTLASITLLSAGAAHADIGQAGTIVLENDLDLNVVHIGEKSPDGVSSSMNGIDLGGAASYFVADGISLGVALNYVHQSEDNDDTQTSIGGSLMAGYQRRVGVKLFVWPRLAIGYAHVSADVGADLSASSVGLSVYVPVLFQPAEHVVIGWGPIMGTEISSSSSRDGVSSEGSKSTVFGTSAMLAAWF